VSLTSDNFNEHDDCVMVGHLYCDQGCCYPDICLVCGFGCDDEDL
jgi:hypothetical protein